jgi:hypothetical protein
LIDFAHPESRFGIPWLFEVLCFSINTKLKKSIPEENARNNFAAFKMDVYKAHAGGPARTHQARAGANSGF